MPQYNTARYCADPVALETMTRDGLGWGHDLDCGCLQGFPETPRLGRLARIFASFKRRNRRWHSSNT